MLTGRIAAIDYGAKRIGLALGDTSTGIASPAGVLPGARGRNAGISQAAAVAADTASILVWSTENAVAGLIVGHPLNMDGTAGPQAKLAEALAAELRAQTAATSPRPLPVELWDERLSSFQADEHLSAAGLKRSKRAGLRDALAAQVILQSYLDTSRGPLHPP